MNGVPCKYDTLYDFYFEYFFVDKTLLATIIFDRFHKKYPFVKSRYD